MSVGDNNTRFFHLTALKHKFANRISKLVVDDRTPVKEEEICGDASIFFSSLLSAEANLDVEAQNSLLEAIPSILKEEKNKFFTAIPSKDEVKAAMFSFEGNKALSSDGFPLFFFQTF